MFWGEIYNKNTNTHKEFSLIHLIVKPTVDETHSKAYSNDGVDFETCGWSDLPCSPMNTDEDSGNIIVLEAGKIAYFTQEKELTDYSVTSSKENEVFSILEVITVNNEDPETQYRNTETKGVLWNTGSLSFSTIQFNLRTDSAKEKSLIASVDKATSLSFSTLMFRQSNFNSEAFEYSLVYIESGNLKCSNVTINNIKFRSGFTTFKFTYPTSIRTMMNEGTKPSISIDNCLFNNVTIEEKQEGAELTVYPSLMSFEGNQVISVNFNHVNVTDC